MWPSRIFGEGEILTPPRPAAPAAWPGGFVVCPLPLPAYCGEAGGWALELYRLAYQQAQTALRPSWHDCAMTASRN
jgi:hypothetical protein